MHPITRKWKISGSVDPASTSWHSRAKGRTRDFGIPWKMRIFDIETTEVLDEFSQFSLPLQSLAYDNVGRFLIACCQDGSVSIHNAARQHLPVKMMQLATAPEYVHVAFTEALPNEQDPQRN